MSIQSLLHGIDQLSKSVGHAFAWCIVILTLGTSYEVFVRYVLDDPTSWAFDMSYILYGGLFLMSGAYALSRGSHVRGDVFYRLMPKRVQGGVEDRLQGRLLVRCQRLLGVGLHRQNELGEAVPALVRLGFHEPLEVRLP